MILAFFKRSFSVKPKSLTYVLAAALAVTSSFTSNVAACKPVDAALENAKIKPLTVLVIGGGPAGLATALEATAHGCDVTVVEKRDAYSRLRWLFLWDYSLKLLEKWEVNTPQMRVADPGDGSLIGFVQIKHLEEQLEKRARESGVKKIQGEFRGFGANQTAVITTFGKKEQALFYDILVGADGTHSNVREALGIEKACWGTAQGAVAIVPDVDAGPTGFDISPALKKEDGFLRRIKMPSASFVFVQFPQRASVSDLQKTVKAQGWSEEAGKLGDNRAIVLADIDVSLQQAKAFSSEIKSAILVGDAAATASFFQGMGANTALKTAEVAGRFFKEMQSHDKAAFLNFNQAMKETTDAMIEDSAFLFNANYSMSQSTPAEDLCGDGTMAVQ